MQEFRACPVRDDRGRLELQQMLQIVSRMKAMYEEHVNSGKIARKQLRTTTSEKIRERWQRF